jgi:hypothetical protein
MGFVALWGLGHSIGVYGMLVGLILSYSASYIYDKKYLQYKKKYG